MDSIRFDALVKQLYVVRSRREGLRVFLAGLVAGMTATTGAERAAATDCLGKDRSCTKNAECCSGICGSLDRKQRSQASQESQHEVESERRRTKGKKGKKAKKGKKGNKKNKRKTRRGDRKGKCDCSNLLERCNASSDCCQLLQACDVNGCEDHKVCCKGLNAPCEDSCECCEENVFCDEESGRCTDCGELKPTQGPCTTTDECCFEGDLCRNIDPACEGREGEFQCCVVSGNACEEDCDCCEPRKCVDGECVRPDGCSNLEGPCEFHEDCCGPNGCVDGQCSACLAPGQACSAGESGRVTISNGSDCCAPQTCVDGTCSDCRKNGESCTVALECCDSPFALCDTNACGAGPVCCSVADEPCTADCDCCATLVCRSDGTCGRPCQERQEACSEDEECCDHPAAVCRFLSPLCALPPDLEQPVCCGLAGTACADVCDCCDGLRCLDDGTCGTPPCAELNEACVFSTDCCDGGEVGQPFSCQTNPGGDCSGRPQRYCCAQANFGPDSTCTDDCDCCGQVQCIDGFCGGPG